MLKTTITAVIVLAFFIATGQAQSETPARNLLDGVYSDAQAARGRTAYRDFCGGCHGGALEGVSAPELTGDHFIELWREARVDTIYYFIRDRMPPGRARGTNPMPNGAYLDILTYILKVNDYPSGPDELTVDLLEHVIVVGKNGPQPVPDGALITTVGCLSQDADGRLVLVEAAEPVRTRTSTTSTRAELDASSRQRLGTLVFRLADLGSIPDFMPDEHTGHKMQAKGYMVRQPNAERISVTSMEMLESTCGE